MRVAIFSTKAFERTFLDRANERHGHELRYLEPSLNASTAPLAGGCQAACLFANDNADAAALKGLADAGVLLIALRSAGFNHVDLEAAERLGLTVARVPAYSPYSVAEHAAGLILTLNRKLHRAYNRVREQNFSLDGLMGFDLKGKTVGLVGTGQIGEALARIMHGFGCELHATDPKPNPACEELGMSYMPLDELLETSDIVSLHCPLTPATHHLINDRSLEHARDGFMLINTSRGGVVDTGAVIRGLKSGKIGALGLDVYEEEGDLFFRDLSDHVIQDDVFMRLMTFPNVFVTAHQGFFTREAVTNIADTTMGNISAFQQGEIPEENIVSAEKFIADK